MTSNQITSDKVETLVPHVPALYHPTLGVGDLEAAREWFTRVFQLPTLRWEDTLDLSLLEPDYPVNYSFFMFIKDFHFVVLCPELHARGALEGQSRYQGVPDGMIGIGWYTNDAVAMFERLEAFGFPSHDQKGQHITAQNPPVSSIASDILVGFTFPEEAGMRHEFEELGERHHEYYARQADPRLRPGWVRPGLDPADPLGIIQSSHHTIVTTDIDRAQRLYVEAVGGQVIESGYNPELDTDSTFIKLGDAVVEFAVPRDSAAEDLRRRVTSGNDYYHGITLQVADLQKVAKHLKNVGITPQTHVPNVLSIDPNEAFGMQWRFVTKLPY